MTGDLGTGSPPTGDGWVDCACGQRHWGLYGAAGLLIQRDGLVLLQHRSAQTHHGDTWALPGGARQPGEAAVAAGLRETQEEAAIAPQSLTPLWWSKNDHGTWSYTTIAARAEAGCEPRVTNFESLGYAWFAADDVARLPLHPAFAGSWPKLSRHLGRHLVLVVDGANVVGARPDGWWKDRAGAASRLRDQLTRLAHRGLPGDVVGPSGVGGPGGIGGPGGVGGPGGIGGPGGVGGTSEIGGSGDSDGRDIGGWWPRIILVVEGQARGIARPDPIGQPGGVEVVKAPGQGDDEILAQAERASHIPGAQVIVATADRELIGWLGAIGVAAIGPGHLWRLMK